MPKFRVVRGGTGPNGQPFALGTTWTAESAADAVAQECKYTHETFSDPVSGMVFGNIKPYPIIKVYACVEVPHEEWKKHASI